MTDFIFYTSPGLTLVCMPGDRPAIYSLAAVAQLTGVHPEMLRYYGRLGLLQALGDGWGSEPSFDGSTLHEVRRIEHYRRHLGVSRRALPLICELWREGRRRRIALNFLHPRNPTGDDRPSPPDDHPRGTAAPREVPQLRAPGKSRRSPAAAETGGARARRRAIPFVGPTATPDLIP